MLEKDQFEKAWLDVYESTNRRKFTIQDWIDFEEIDEFSIIWFKKPETKKSEDCIGEMGNLEIYPRHRIRTPFHSYMVSKIKQDPSIAGAKTAWNITINDLISVVDIANSMDYVVTYSTIKSGATVPLQMHFQIIPKKFNFDRKDCIMFDWLFSHAQFSNTVKYDDGVICKFLKEPVNIIKLYGEKIKTCKRLFTLCLGYDHFKSFNLIFKGNSNKQNFAEINFIPRRYDGKFRPDIYKEMGYGAFEMGGLFLFDLTLENKYNYTRNNLERSLREITPQDGSIELRTMMNVLNSF